MDERAHGRERHSTVTDAVMQQGVTGDHTEAEWKGTAPCEMHRASLQRSPGPIGWQRVAHHRLMICWRHEMSDNACHGRW